MTPQLALDLAYRTLMTAAKVAAPILITAIVIGIVVNIIQTVVSIKDMSLTFVPKIVGSAIVAVFTMPWIFQVMTSFFEEIYMMFGTVAP